MSALLLPMFLGAAGLGVEASNWSVIQTELQRAADAASISAVVAYQATSSAQTAANAAADVAELNGVAAGTRHWTSATSTLTDGLTTVQQVNGVRLSSDIAFRTTAQRTVTVVFGKLFVAAGSYTIAAASISEAIPSAPAQPCILSLGTTSSAVSLSGAATITASACSVRSDGGVTLSGSASITAASVYAASAITTSGTAAVHATRFPNSGTIPDPYAKDTGVQSAFADLGSCGSCTAVNLSGATSQTINPGTYSSISTSGQSKLTMNPGLYVVNGNVSSSGGSSITANGVTIVTSGSVSMSGTAQSTLTAPGPGATGGAIPGMAIAGPSASGVNMSGGSNLVITGIVYFPKAGLAFSGTSGNPSSPCLELIALTVTISGTANLTSSGCPSYGAKTFGSLNTSIAALVQ